VATVSWRNASDEYGLSGKVSPGMLTINIVRSHVLA
jgi:hypothetical protein